MAFTRLLVCLLGITTVLALPNSRILEGDEAVSAEFPWVVSVRVNNAHVCGGSIISERHILTAGKCVSETGSTPYAVSKVSVRVGSINLFAGGSIVGVSSIKIHESFGNFLHDISLLTLSAPLAWTDRIQSIELPDAEEENDVEDGAELIVTGWGLQSTGASPYKLQHATMHAMAASECEYRAGFGYESVLCIDHPEKQGICRGDDGTGVVSNGKLVGVVSFAFGNCGTKYPDVSSRVSYYLPWIHSAME